VAAVVAEDECTEWLRGLTMDELRVVRDVIEAKLRAEESDKGHCSEDGQSSR
jgi:hypothetical protein